jgi:hypothetical protein
LVGSSFLSGLEIYYSMLSWILVFVLRTFRWLLCVYLCT